MSIKETLNPLFDGMQSVRRRTFIAAAAALSIAGIASGQHTIGLKLGMNGNGNQQSGAAGALLPTDSAGAPGYAQINWNILGRWGDNGTNSFGTNAYPVLDSNGDDTFLTINWDATGNWSQAGGGTPTAQGTPDGNLMNGYCDSGGSANVAPGATVYGNSGNNKPLV